MTTRKRNATIPDAPHSECLNDAAKADATAATMPAAQKPPRPARRPKEKRAATKGTTAPGTFEDHTPNGTDPATGTAVASAPAGSKLDRLLVLLRQPDGATIVELMDATGWQAHYADARIMPM